ncbi:plasmid mobilization relaxosome protein MobC [Sphingobacterium sp.]|uniref:plasmid mobilization protein n=1 Tax=Sphingobacterium sp. TaxID=341027 RepID=UPI0031DC9A3F
MNEKKNNREKWLHVRLTEQEFNLIQEQFRRTMERKISVYIRSIILGKPMIGKVRNQSADELITVLGTLRMELKAAGINLNQAVKKLHTMRELKGVEAWLVTWELDKKRFFKSLEQITNCLTKIDEQWYQ